MVCPLRTATHRKQSSTTDAAMQRFRVKHTTKPTEVLQALFKAKEKVYKLPEENLSLVAEK